MILCWHFRSTYRVICVNALLSPPSVIINSNRGRNFRNLCSFFEFLLFLELVTLLFKEFLLKCFGLMESSSNPFPHELTFFNQGIIKFELISLVNEVISSPEIHIGRVRYARYTESLVQALFNNIFDTKLLAIPQDEKTKLALHVPHV